MAHLQFLRVAGLAFLTTFFAGADVTLPTLLADHMVLQRNQPVHIWGKAAPGEAVSVGFRGESKEATADGLGRWSVYLAPGEAGGPFVLTVQGRNRVVRKDILVGEVWVAAGQSNMEWPVRWAADPNKEIAAAIYPKVRLFRAMHRVSDYPLEDLYGKSWTECRPDSAADFSAVGYHFAREMQERLGVPVGIIQAAWGGTPADAWTRLSAIAADASLAPALAEWAALMESYPEVLLRYDRECKDWEAAAARAKAEKKEPPALPARPNGPGLHWKPGAIYNAIVSPLTRYPIRGVIWYQGESNTSPERAPVYGRMFQTLIQDWRRQWGLGDVPFLFVQISRLKATPESMWPELREAQRQALSIANTAMAVTIDIGDPDNIHPKNKREVARRLALAARAVVYGEKVEYSGPAFRQATRESGALRLWFDHAGGGLAAKEGALRGFEIAGSDEVFVPARARIDGATVVVSTPAVPAPHNVRYGWADNPECNLYNAEGLPASPFRPGM